MNSSISIKICTVTGVANLLGAITLNQTALIAAIVASVAAAMYHIVGTWIKWRNRNK